MGELECLVLKDYLDKVRVSETKWNDGNQWNTVIPGYELYRQDKKGSVQEGIVLNIIESHELVAFWGNPPADGWREQAVRIP